VYEEYRVRKSYGDTPETDVYLSRYPHLAETLRGFFGGNTDQTRRDAAKPNPNTKSLDQSVAIPKDEPHAGSESMLPAVGQYQLLEMLGKGQFGEVWRAKAPGGVEVAVKVISQPSDRESARRELQALELVKNLRHPTLMATLAFWEHLNKVYIVVELAEGTLRTRMQECKASGKEGIPPEELVTYIESSADGLDFLHSKNVFHRDVKPDNILIASGHAKVADFGLARAQDRPDMSVSFAGTPVYMAPEVWGGKFSARSDQYSLAVTYAELRLGRRPLDGKDFVELMSRQLDEPPDLKGLPPNEKAVLARALAKQPDKRYESCRQFADALFEAVHGPPGAGGSGGRSVPLWIILFAVAILVATGIGVYLAVFYKPSLTTSQTTTPETPPVKPEQKPTIGDPTVPPIVPPVVPDPNRPVLPDGYQPVGTATKPAKGKDYPLKIERIATAGSSIPGPVPTFILVTPPTGKPFYIMDTKVWNGLMKWSGVGKSWDDRQADVVAVEVSLAEAMACAAKLGGRVPTPAEWDATLGFSPGTQRASLIEAGTTPLVNSAKPGRVDLQNRDSTKDGVSNMTGNGRELTAALVSDEERGWKPLPDPVPTGKESIVLRGRSFTLATPLTVADLTAEQKVPQTQYADAKSKYTGFRVVLDLPKE
jgi:serine/threonine protein kinase